MTPICLAPHNSLFFSMTGKAYFCLANRTLIPGTYPENSVKEIIEGKVGMELRKEFQTGDFGRGCEKCKLLHDQGMSAAAFYNFHKEFEPQKDFLPRYIDFELDNRCNLSCSMCRPFFSSLIPFSDGASNQYRSPYDEAFYQSFDPYIPHLVKAHFRGGEPFVIKRYHDFWERLMAINPSIRIGATTNGTVLPERVMPLIRKGNFDINISLDSLERKTWESIRVGGDFETWRHNLDLLLSLKKKGTIRLSACICLMTLNYKEIPALFEFCNKNKVTIHINYVETPHYLSLAAWSNQQLQALVKAWEKRRLRGRGPAASHNAMVFRTLLHHLQHWISTNRQVLYPTTYSVASLEEVQRRFWERLAPYEKEIKALAWGPEELQRKMHALKDREIPGFPLELAFAELNALPVETILQSLQHDPPEEVMRKILEKYYLAANILKYGNSDPVDAT